MVVFKNTLKNIFKGIAVLLSVLTTTALHANYGGMQYDNKQIDCLTRNTYEEANKLTLFQTRNNLRFY